MNRICYLRWTIKHIDMDVRYLYTTLVYIWQLSRIMWFGRIWMVMDKTRLSSAKPHSFSFCVCDLMLSWSILHNILTIRSIALWDCCMTLTNHNFYIVFFLMRDEARVLYAWVFKRFRDLLATVQTQDWSLMEYMLRWVLIVL